MPLEQNKSVILEYHEQVWNQGKLEQLEQYYAPNFADYTAATHALDGLAERIRMFRAGIPNLNIRIAESVAEDDMVAIRWQSTGTHQGELFGKPASGNRIEMTGMSFFRLADGKIVEEWSEMDFASFMEQLSVS